MAEWLRPWVGTSKSCRVRAVSGPKLRPLDRSNELAVRRGPRLCLRRRDLWLCVLSKCCTRGEKKSGYSCSACSICEDSSTSVKALARMRDRPLRNIPPHKTDQERSGVTIAIAKGDIACPAKALRAWLDAAGIESGPIFRPIDKGGTVRASRLTDRSVANIVKAYAGRAGFDASTFSGHSLRAGFLTSAAGKGASIFKMMDVSRHKSVDTLRGYVRDAELFKDHAGTGLL
jgi:hypothetical protein